jgi:RimJ/RimL family protein N-acetyltransferase
LARLVGAEVPDNWPPEDLADALPHFLVQLQLDPSLVGWLSWYWIARREGPAMLIGTGGFKGHPGSLGAVEVGYAVLPQFRRHGYATEGVGALISWAFSHIEVRRINAEVLSSNQASIRVLQKLGFRSGGMGSGHRLTRYELPKHQYERALVS